MEKRPKILTAAVVEFIRGDLSALGFSFDGEDIDTPELLLRVLEQTDAECVLLHIGLLESCGRRRFLKAAKQLRDMPVIAIGSKSDLSNDGIKKCLKDGLLTAIFADGGKLIANLERAIIKAVTGNMQPNGESEEPPQAGSRNDDCEHSVQTASAAETTAAPKVPGQKPSPAKRRPPQKKQRPAPQQLSKPVKPPRCKTIAVFQSLSGCGCTWTAACLAAWLKDNGMRTALVGEENVMFLPPESAPEPCYSYEGLDVFGRELFELKQQHSSYDYVVMDLGALLRIDGTEVHEAQNITLLNEVGKADIRVLAADAGRTRRPLLESLLEAFCKMGLAFSTAIVRAPEAAVKELRRLVKNRPLALMPVIPDPFERTPERDAFCASLFFSTGGNQRI